jgi:hypothetical protein
MVSTSAHMARPEAAARLIQSLLLQSYRSDLPRLADLLASPRLRAGLDPDDSQRLQELAGILADAAQLGGAANQAQTLAPSEGLDRAARWIAREKRLAISMLAAVVVIVAGLVAYLAASHRVSERLRIVEANIDELRGTADTLSRLVTDR